MITKLKYFWEMSTKNRVNLELDQYRRIGIKDVISMLKGLRNEAVIKIVQASEVSENCLLYTSPSPRDGLLSRMPSSA